ncbi:hypothetical protein IP81_08815 [Novosphingobium sp. AAP83]|uniref:hypothetical protein n=1 Tax=Novosphingobium sp. AAP83 TaxID=1523425 RepID=UPI0006B8CBE6|nr:hypothetical protein [Novosphingobium sp. AAP83]KPF92119.1 hypothetical protein IP81_08815 [Novosphingobium sp. AAP83]
MIVIEDKVFGVFERERRDEFTTRLHSALAPLSHRLDRGITLSLLDRIIEMAEHAGYETETDVAAFGALWLIVDVICGSDGALNAMLDRMEDAEVDFTIFDLYDSVAATL